MSSFVEFRDCSEPVREIIEVLRKYKLTYSCCEFIFDRLLDYVIPNQTYIDFDDNMKKRLLNKD